MRNDDLNSVFPRKRFIEYLMAGLFFCSLLLVYPLMWSRLLYKVDLLGFFMIMTPAVITLLACAGCCFRLGELKLALKRNLFFATALAVIAGVVLSHLLTVKNIGTEDIAGSLVWIVVPLFVFLYHRRITELLPWFMALLWILNCWQLIAEQVWQWNSRMTGVTGNNNWSAGLLIVSTAFLLHLIWGRVTGKSQKTRYGYFAAAAIPLTILSAVMLYRLYSKGANAALLIAAVITLLLYYGNWRQRSFKIIILVAVAGAAIALFFIFKSDLFVSFAARDVRLPLWAGALNLVLDNQINGVSPAAFESSFAPYIPVDYYLRGSIAAARNSHPHSHLLYFAASFGIIATLVWGWLIICPLFVQIRCRLRCSTVDSKQMIYVFSLLVLLLHGMVDLTLFSWPCGYIFLIILGLLWRDCWNVDYKSQKAGGLLVVIGAALGILLLGYGSYIAYLNCGSSYLNREALIQLKGGQPQTALQSCNRSLAYKITPQTLYRAAMISLFDLEKPELALGYLEKFDQTTYGNYISNNGLRARALCVQRQPVKALPFFERESKNYPLGSLNWHFYYYTLRMLNLKKAAQIAKDNLLYSLEAKGMTAADISLLIKKPELDITFLEGDGKTPKINRLRRNFQH
jgi:O-antigen ligase